MATFSDAEFVSQADEIMVEAEGTEDIREFIEAWFQWNLGDPSWADQLWEMLAYPPEQRAALKEEWQ